MESFGDANERLGFELGQTIYPLQRAEGEVYIQNFTVPSEE